VSERMGDGTERVLAGRYRIEGELGRGGMARVFKATDTVLGRPVAVKVLAPQYAEDANFVTRFRREAQAAARLNHRNLVGVYDTGSDDGTHFIVMEFVDARTLADFLAGGSRIMPDRAIELAEAVCDALAVAHAQGVIHRDIKPANIMVTRSGEVKVTDFGIARVTSNETVAQTAAVLGTASYLSPEQAQGQPVDQRSDIYSLGCVLYEMVTGRPPFSADTAVAVASKHVLETPTPPSRLNADVSPELEAVILRALSKNPDNRYQSAEEMKADLERVRTGRPVMATPVMPGAAETQMIHRAEPQPTAVLPPGYEQPAAEPGRRTPGWLIAVIVLLVLGVLGILLWLVAQEILGGNEQQPTLVTVPDVEGQPLREAQDALEAEGLKWTIVRRVEDTEAEPGSVLDQNPQAGDRVEPGTEIELTVAKTATETIPTDLAGQPADDVVATLQALGFTDVTTQTEESAEFDEGQVIRTEPPEGTEDVPLDSTITVFVSSGAGTVTVPEVRCQSFTSAQNELERAGLNGVIDNETVELNPQCPTSNKVADQDPDPGAEVEPGSTVTLYGGEPTESPSPPGDGEG
jgi:eukaryotic-like serine/threonine-protein kinase